MYVNLVIDTKSRYMDSLFTYEAPDGVKVGDVVSVPFNKNNKERTGYVAEIDVKPACDVSQIKPVIRKISDYSLNEEMMKTAAWMRTRYGIKYIDAIKCFIPPGKPPKPGKEKRPYKDMVPEPQDIEQLTDEQYQAVSEICAAVSREKPSTSCLKGVTSSGKTEVYMRAIEHALDRAGLRLCSYRK